MIPDVPLIEAKETFVVQEPILRSTADGSNRGGRFGLALLRDAIEKGEFPSDPNVSVEFQSVSRQRYRVTLRTARLQHGVRTDFVRLEQLSPEEI